MTKLAEGLKDAPDTVISQLQIDTYNMMSTINQEIQEDDKQRKHSLQSSINTISRILNELRTQELTNGTDEG